MTSDNKTKQLAAAVLIRKYLAEEIIAIDHSLEIKKDKNTAGDTIENAPTIEIEKTINLKSEAINVISALLRILPTGAFQKTLADGLGYAKDLTKCDLQKINLQDALLVNKNGELVMDKADLFLADLSYANVEGIRGIETIFYEATLFNTRFRNCNFTNADFRNADLTGVSFKGCTLTGAKFTGATHIPLGIDLTEGDERKCTNTGKIKYVCDRSNGKTVFFSMPGQMKKEQEILTLKHKEYLIEKDYNVVYYTPDKYPGYGQFDRVLHDIKQSTAMIVFGFKQLKIEKALYREGTKDEAIWNDKWHSTLWNEIEAGMGLMHGIPILLVCDDEIKDGVFDQDLSECYVLRISTETDVRTLEQNPIYREWLSRF